MYEAAIKNLRRKISRKARFFQSHTNLYVFGASDQSRNVIKLLREKNLSVSYIVDNNTGKQGMFFYGIKVISPQEIQNISDSSNSFVICSSFWREMTRQLLREGVNQRQILVLSLERPYAHLLVYSVYKQIRGKHIYERIIRQYPNRPILICPYTGTGDIYLIGTLLQQYLTANNIYDYVFAVVSSACKKVAQLFGIRNIIQLKSTDECGYLMQYYVFHDDCQLKILNDCWPEVYTNRTEWIRGLHGLNFTEMFRRFVFELDEKAEPIAPALPAEKDKVQKLLDTYGLKGEKTVVLSPYSNTLADLPNAFWEEVANRLKQKGYSVCTNTGKTSETAVKGTVAVFVPFNLAIQFLNAAGGFIGVRSGFCDVISSSTAKKVILYDANNYFYNCSAYEYFSLNEMGLCSDAVEIQYHSNQYLESIDKILNCF